MNSPNEEFQAGRGFVRMNNLSVMHMTGTDRITVLNNFCTADIKLLDHDRGTEAFITDVRGRTLGHVCAYNTSDSLMLVGNPGQAERVSSHIDRYIIREDAAITDHSDAVIGWLISGAEQSPQFAEIAMEESPGLAHGVLQINGVACDWFQAPWTSEQDVLIVAKRSDAEAVEAMLGEQGLSPCDEEAFQVARIQSGWPIYGIDFSDANLPQEVDRNEKAISFTKGCYLGQETVARLDALGQVQKKLVCMRIDGETVPPSGTSLVEGEKACGEIRSAVWSPRDNAVLGIGFVRRKWFDPGSRLKVADSEQMMTVL